MGRPPFSLTHGAPTGLVVLLCFGAPFLALGAPSAAPSGVGPALTIAIGANTTQGAAPLLVFFTATVSGTATTSTLYNWSFGDGSHYNNTSANDLVHSYGRVGVFQAQVETSYGTSTANSSIRIIVEASALVATVAATPVANAPLTMSFRAQVSGGTGTYTSVLWQFGDARSASSLVALETYPRAGNYTANFTATDSAGATVTRSLELNLTAPPSNGTAPAVSTWAVVWEYLPWGIAIVAVLLAMQFALRPRRRRAGEGETEVAGAAPAAKGPSSPAPSSEAPPGATEGPRPSEDEAAPIAPSVSAEVSPTSGDVSQSSVGPGTPLAASPTASSVAPGLSSAPSSEGPAKPSSGSAPPPSPSPQGEDAPRPPAVPRETLKLSFRIVLHIAAQGALPPHEVAPPALTQAGMSQALGARQNTIATILKRLEVAGVLTSDVRHVKGAPRRMKVYRLTHRGEALAHDIRARRPASTPSAPEPKG